MKTGDLWAVIKTERELRGEEKAVSMRYLHTVLVFIVALFTIAAWLSG